MRQGDGYSETSARHSGHVFAAGRGIDILYLIYTPFISYLIYCFVHTFILFCQPPTPKARIATTPACPMTTMTPDMSMTTLPVQYYYSDM